MAERRAILVVDDEQLMRNILRAILEVPGVDVYEADTCSKARKWLDNVRFDAVVLDNGMPDGRGLDLVLPFREKCRRVIMVSGDAHRIREQARRLGAEAVFPKPFDAFALEQFVLGGWQAEKRRSPDPTAEMAAPEAQYNDV